MADNRSSALQEEYDKSENHRKKVDELHKKTAQLLNSKDPTDKIAAFLIRFQLVETLLRKLVIALLRYLRIKTKVSIPYKHPKKDKEVNELEVGRLLAILNCFSGDPLMDELSSRISNLNSIRTDVFHRLYEEDRDLESLIKRASDGLDKIEEVIELIFKCWNKAIKSMK